MNADKRRRTYVVIKQDYTQGATPHETIVGETTTPQAAIDLLQQHKEQLRRTNPGASITFRYQERKTTRQERTTRAIHGPEARADIHNCEELRHAVTALHNKVSQGNYSPEHAKLERSILIQDAFKLGCTDAIPDSWVIEFKKDDNG